MAPQPQNIGIKAIEIYFPNQYVEQSELEAADGVSMGKYTIGLGQTKMSICDDREDIYSLALTVTANLLSKYHIDPQSVGRMEVGTSTILDKSKSVKSVLMQLFGNNTNIEGVDTINGSYGGTNAFFNSLNWIESSAWDGRDAIVVAGDINIYKSGNLRPTGGASAVAMLIGPDAPIVVEPGLRGTYMQHTYDFYKPDLTSEYPIVDSLYSKKCYIKALDSAYSDYCKKEAKKAMSNTNSATNVSSVENKTNLDRFDYLAFHTPSCNLVPTLYSRLLYHDFLANPDSPAFTEVSPSFRNMDYETSLTDKALHKTFKGLTQKLFLERVKPAIQVATMCGNTYCASVWSGLVSLLSFVDSKSLHGKRLGLFSYGSGLASSFMSFRINGDTKFFSEVLDIKARLAARCPVSPQEYDQICDIRSQAYLSKSFTPRCATDSIFPKTYFLVDVDDKFRRSYSVKK